MKCKRGTGRQKAFEKTTGDYVFYVDLDSIYSPALSCILYNAIKKNSAWKDRDNVVCDFLYKRSTLERIGGWRDLNVFEDTELEARMASKGIIHWSMPVYLCENEYRLGMRFRDARYGSGKIGKLLRLYSSAEDSIVGNGAVNINQVGNVSPLVDIGLKIAYINVRLKGRKIYSYAKNQANDEYCSKRIRLISPALFKVPKRYWRYELYCGRPNVPADREKLMVKKRLRSLQKMGFDKVKKINNWLLLSTSKTDNKLLKREAKYLASIVV